MNNRIEGIIEALHNYGTLPYPDYENLKAAAAEQAQEIDTLKTELAVTQAALTAQNEALAAARQAITQAHDLLGNAWLGYGNYQQVNGAWNILNQQVTSWGGAANATADESESGQ